MRQDDSTVRNADVMAREIDAKLGEFFPEWEWDQRNAIAADLAEAAFAALSPADGATGAEVDPDLRQRAWEVLHWRKTGLLEGDALDALAAREGWADTGSEPSPVRRAEDHTIRQALAFVVAQRPALTPTETGEQGK